MTHRQAPASFSRAGKPKKHFLGWEGDIREREESQESWGTPEGLLPRQEGRLMGPPASGVRACLPALCTACAEQRSLGAAQRVRNGIRWILDSESLSECPLVCGTQVDETHEFLERPGVGQSRGCTQQCATSWDRHQKSHRRRT